MPATPRWLLAIPDAIRQLAALDRELLTRGDVEQLFGVSRARAATLMQTFGAELTGNQRTLPRTQLLRQLRKHRARAAFRGEADRRERLLTELRTARLTGIRVAVPSRRSRDGSPACPRASTSRGTGSKCGSPGRRRPSGGSSRSPRR